MIRLRRCPSPALRSPAGRRNCARTSASASWPASNSSNASRDQNGPSGRISVSSIGTCTRCNASAIGGKLQRLITSGLIHSGSAGSFSNACEMARRSEPSASPTVSGYTGSMPESFASPASSTTRSGWTIWSVPSNICACRTHNAFRRPAGAFRRNPVAPGNTSARHRRCRRWHRPDVARASVHPESACDDRPSLRG